MIRVLEGLGAGAGVAGSLLLLAWPRRPLAWQPRRRRRPALAVLDGARLIVEPRARRPLAWLRASLGRAGRPTDPWPFCTACAGAALATGTATAVGAQLIGLPAAAAGILTAGLSAALMVRSLVAAGSRRRERLLGELAPTLDLVGIELGGGSSPITAFSSVVTRTGGGLAAELRLALAAATIGGPAFDVRLAALGEHLDAPPLAAVAAVLATSRDYGSGVAHGLRSISLDLRRARRRELIAAGRRSLVKVLVPATVGVLLPFMAILLYPAVAALVGTFR